MEEQMKRLLLKGMLGILVVLVISSGMPARTYRRPAADNFLTFSCFIQPLSFGYKHRVHDYLYANTNLDYIRSDSDLEFRLGAEYLFPRKIIIFKLYGGGGLQFSRNEGYQYPYVAIGTNFLFLFAEIIHPLKSEMGPKYRAGFSFTF